jgi:hypothetical protein
MRAGAPIRTVRVAPMLGSGKIELVVALYADLQIAPALGARDTPWTPPGAAIWERFHG